MGGDRQHTKHRWRVGVIRSPVLSALRGREAGKSRGTRHSHIIIHTQHNTYVHKHTRMYTHMATHLFYCVQSQPEVLQLLRVAPHMFTLEQLHGVLLCLMLLLLMSGC